MSHKNICNGYKIIYGTGQSFPNCQLSVHTNPKQHGKIHTHINFCTKIASDEIFVKVFYNNSVNFLLKNVFIYNKYHGKNYEKC